MIPNIDKDEEKLKCSYTAGRTMDYNNYIWKLSGNIYQSKGHVNLKLFQVLGLHTRKVSTNVYQKTWTRIFTEAFFIIVKNYKLFKYPLKRKWINKLLYIHVIKCYQVIKNTTVKQNMDPSHRHNVKQKKPHTEVYHSIHMNFRNGQFIYGA